MGSQHVRLGSLGPPNTTRTRSRYYDNLMMLLLQFGSNARSVLEVGCAKTPFLEQAAWIPDRTCVAPYFMDYNAAHLKPGSGSPMPSGGAAISRGTTSERDRFIGKTNLITADFLEWRPSRTWDVVVCSQVVEHIEDARAFVVKLIKVARYAIISVPYHWRDEGSLLYQHKQHNITAAQFLQWASPHRPVTTMIVRDDTNVHERIIMVFSNANHH